LKLGLHNVCPIDIIIFSNNTENFFEKKILWWWIIYVTYLHNT